MAEETAGIGTAKALITRAKPQDFGILQGLKMAESSALAKAKLAAAAEAKKQAKLDKMSRFMTKVDRLKEPATQKEANELAYNSYLESESGNLERAYQAERNYNFKIPFIIQKDEEVHKLNPSVNKTGINTSNIYKAYNEGGLEAAVNAEKPWIPKNNRIIQPQGDGFFVANIPTKYDRNKKYASQLGRISPDKVVVSENDDFTKIVKSLTPTEISLAAKSLVDNDKAYGEGLLHEGDFQDYYEEKYKGQDLNNPIIIDKAVRQFTRDKIADYSDAKTSVSRGGGGLEFHFGGGGASTKRYDFTKEVVPFNNFKDLIKRENLNFGEADVLGEVTSKTQEWLNQSVGSGDIIRVNLPSDVPFTFSLVDLNRKNKGDRSTQPQDLIKTKTGQVYLIYGDNNDSEFKRYVVPLTTTMKNNLYAWYKDDRKDIQGAIEGLLGGTVAPFDEATKRAKANQAKGKPKPTGKTISRDEYSKMNAAQRKSFKDNGGVVK